MKIYTLWGLFIPGVFHRRERQCLVIALPFVSIFFDYHPGWNARIDPMRKPWKIKHHGRVVNKSVEGGFVDMYLVCEDISGRGAVSFAAHPDDAREIITHIVALHNASIRKETT